MRIGKRKGEYKDMAVMNLTKENFKQEVLEAQETVLVDFWATWCGPCQMMSPVVEEIAQERTDVKVCKVNVDDQMELARQYRVLSIPTFLVFKNGEVAGSMMGAQPKEKLTQLFEK